MVKTCDVVALSLKLYAPNVSRETLSQYIEELFLAEVQSLQGIMADNVWLELNGDIELKLSPPKVGKLLRKTEKTDKLFFFFEGRPHWEQNIVSLA